MTTSPQLAPASPAKRSLRILYAEDVRELREVARISLSREGHQIECAVDGLAALQRLQSGLNDFDVLITDHHMPNMNGLELVRRVRDTEFTGKVLVFSSELSEKIAQSYRDLHVDRVIPKPIFPSELRKILAEI